MTEPVLELLEQVWSDLAHLGAELDAADWSRPTDCPGWSVRDQFAHVIGTERMLLGDRAPAAEAGETPHVRNEIGRANEQWITAYRHEPSERVLAELIAVTDRRRAALRALSPEQWDAEGFTPEGPGPYRRFMEIRVFDCWYHEQDVREAVGRSGHLEGPVADAALGRIASALPYVVGKRAAAPTGVTVVFEIAGATPLRVAVGVDGWAALLDAVPEHPTVRIGLDRRAYNRLAGGRWDAARAFAEGVSLEGDERLGRQVVAAMGYTI